MSDKILITHARFWPGPGEAIQDDVSILIKKGRIEQVGTFRKMVRTTIDAEGGLVMPGLIQTHVHLCQTIFRGLGEDMALLPWLQGVVWPMEAAHDPDSLRASALLACAEMIKGGTTAFMSMETVRHTEAVFEAVHEAGLYGVICPCLMDETGGYEPLAVDIDTSLEDCDRLRKVWAEDPRLKVGLAPRFALSCSAENMRIASDYAREYGMMLHTHASEQPSELAWIREKTGMTNIEYLHSVGLTGPDVGLAHCVHTDARERELLRDTETNVLHCPSANLKLGSGVAPIPEYLAMGITVSMGADGAPCNNRLDQFVEMRAAGLIQKPRLGPDAMPARDVVRMATELGAKTLGWEKEMGTLEEGKRANLMILAPDCLAALPPSDPATDLVYSHQSSDVVLTMVDGEILYANGELTTIDEAALVEKVKGEQANLIERAGL